MARTANIPPFMEQEFNAFKKFQAPWGNIDIFLSNLQKNMECINTNQKIATESTQALMELQNEYLQHIFNQCNERMMDLYSNAPVEEKAKSQAELLQTTLDEAFKHISDLNSIISESNKQMIETSHQRLKDYLKESFDLAKKGRKE